MPVIAADCHVIESERTWDYMDAADERYRPRPVEVPGGGPVRAAKWIIEGRADRRTGAPTTARSNRDSVSGYEQTTASARTLDDIAARLAHMDELGVDVQILYPTAYLGQISTMPEVDLALAKSYNRWLADIWSQADGRLRWIAVPPLLSMSDVPEQLRFAKENGACGIYMRGFEGDKLLVDPYFYPLYETASELDMPICVHSGSGSNEFDNVVAGEAFSRAKFPVLSAFHSLILHETHAKFPVLRFGFIEAAAQWLPYVLTDLKRRMVRESREPLSDNPLADYNMYVACQTNDDLPHIISYVGEDNLVIGSDYGHNDTSTELEALRTFASSGVVDERVVTKILEDNPRRLYAV
jgi:predicted TIM-barrel fold metal-dependent hydrolase